MPSTPAATTSSFAAINHSTLSRRSRPAARQANKPAIALLCVLLHLPIAKAPRKPGASPLNTRNSHLAWSLRSSRQLLRAEHVVVAGAKAVADVDVVVAGTATTLHPLPHPTAVPAVRPQHNRHPFPRAHANQLASMKDSVSASFQLRCPKKLPRDLFLGPQPIKWSNVFRKAGCSSSKLRRLAAPTIPTVLPIPISHTPQFATIWPRLRTTLFPPSSSIAPFLTTSAKFTWHRRRKPRMATSMDWRQT